MKIGLALRDWARRFKRQSLTVYCIARHPGCPPWPRLVALLTAAYALSPIDLIPDFIPVLGYLDDFILIPLGLMLALRLTPNPIIHAAREQAQGMANRPVSRMAAWVIGVLWLGVILVLIAW